MLKGLSMRLFFGSLFFLFHSFFINDFGFYELPSSEINPIELPPMFTSNMVLPRDKPFPLHGKASTHEVIQIRIQNQSHQTKADSQGKWQVIIDPLKIGPPIELRIEGKQTLILKNILVGDLWLCAGQSNMQYTLDMLNYKENKDDQTSFDNLRLFNVNVGLDYLPKEDVSGSGWKIASAETARSFSATGLFFGRYLAQKQDVPIGLISSNLGATNIETWMSVGALKQFPQFDEVTDDLLSTNKSFETIDNELKEFRKTWDNEHYLKGIGMDEKWYEDAYDDSSWKSTEVPMFLEYLGYEDHDGSFWFRRTFDVDSNQVKNGFHLALNQIDDYDITWVNGKKVGESFGNRNFRGYDIPGTILREKNNTLTIRVFDVGGLGGPYTSAFWGNKILNGKWKYRKGRAIDINNFPIPKVVNGSLFSHPTLLYNANIAPLFSLPMAGVIWYQGEGNESRAVEYESLLKALIIDWRKGWGNEKLPFLIVQLANYRTEAKAPAESNWAELRNSQMKAAELPYADIMTAIDIGEANDIHPYNKREVGFRLGKLAMHYTYNSLLQKGSTYMSHMIENDKVIVKMNTYNSKLVSKDKYGYLRGFSIAGKDGKFIWAKAHLKSKTEVIVYSEKISNPKYVRYAWSDNPGQLDLYSENGLPAFPFRTDELKLKTKDIKFKFDEHGF